MSAHAKLSPSARHRWQKCPASVRVCQQYEGDGKSSPAAVDGTHSHTLLEECIKHAADATLYVGQTIKDNDGEFTVEMDRAARVQVALDYVSRRVKDLPGAAVHSEKLVDPFRLLGRSDMSGTVDIHIIADRYLEVIDYKDGMARVPAVGNPQLQQYVFGILAEHVSDDGTFPFDNIRLTIIQPKLALKGEPVIDSWEVSIEEAAEWYADLMAEAVATDDQNAPFVPGEKQCHYCAHAGNCSAATKFAFGKSGIEFENMDFAREAAEKPSDSLTDEQLRGIIEAAPMLRKMIENAEDEALRRIQKGHPVEGIKAVKGAGRRGWKDDEEVVAQRLIRMGVPKGSVWETKLVSPSAVEKLRWTKRDGTAKQLSERQLATVMDELVSKSEGKLTVVPAADKRPAVEFANLEQMFGSADAQSANLPTWLS